MFNIKTTHAMLLSLHVGAIAASASWPAPNSTLRPVYHLGGLDNAPGYVGDANGMMFRRVPFDSASDEGGLFHVAWQCSRTPTSGLEWCHSTSQDFVKWTSLPPMITTGGAESGGVAQLPNGDVVAIFNQVGGGGHWQARPTNASDPHLVHWTDRNPDGSECSGKCKPTPGIPGTDLSQAFKMNDDDTFWRVIADRPDSGGAVGAALVARTKNFTSFEVEGLFHQYKWDRCVTIPSLCGFGPYPRDPNAFRVDGDIWVFYGMQKTCSFSGREYYALGTYNAPGSFEVLDTRSDYANNVWDGGEGYASMHVYDPIGQRMLWIPAVIEGDRDPCGDKTGEGFWQSWLSTRRIGAGWFGTLGLPRVTRLDNLTTFVESGTFVRLRTEALPELSSLRSKGIHSARKLEPNTDVVAEPLRGQAVELVINVSRVSEFDFGARVLWSDDDAERTIVGIRSGEMLPGIDLHDEVNGDSGVFDVSEATRIAAVNACKNACQDAADCTAWTFSSHDESAAGASGKCRFKQYAQHSLQGSNANGAFQPFAKGSTSGYICRSSLCYASLYIDRTKSTAAVDDTYGKYPNWNYSAVVPVLPDEKSLKLQIFVDGSIVEAFAQNGRAVVTARVYPSNPTADRIGLFSRKGSLNATLDAFTLVSALAPPWFESTVSRGVEETQTEIESS